MAAAGQLKYRDFLLVGLIVAEPNLFPTTGFTCTTQACGLGRIQNFGNWSPDMAPEPGMSSLGLEYFCNEGDALWNTPDAELIELAKRELEQSGLVRQADVVDGVLRVEKSYPVYDSRYRDCLAQVRAFVDSLPNFQPIGRNGLHRYNNQDHAMLTGLAAGALNLALGERNDLWRINAAPEYHEEAPGQGAGDKPAGTINGNAARVRLTASRWRGACFASPRQDWVAIGRVRVKVLPRPGLLLAVTVPPCASTSCLTIASPSPAWLGWLPCRRSAR